MADEHDIGGKGPERAPALVAGPAKKPADATVAEAKAPDEGAVARGTAQVDDYRKRIDQIDEQLMMLLNSRSACAVEIGRIKRHIGMPVYQPDHESRRLERLAGQEEEHKEGV
jgi:hypothetical protein